MPSFIHLHTHSDYSLLDGAIPISRLLERAKELKMPALALTDHGNVFGAVEFYQKAKNEGIKPIIGCEMYIAPESRFKKKRTRGEDFSFHLTVLVKNKTGYQNLMELITSSYVEGFYYHPRIDKEILEEKKEGLIVLSGCFKNEIISLLLQEKEKEAKEVISFYRDLFGEDFYLEIQKVGLDDEPKVNEKLVKLSRELKIPLVVSNDVHYLTSSDSKIHDVLLCIQTGKTLKDEKRLRFSSHQLYFRSPEEMESLFSELPEALKRTLEIAEKCEFEMDLGKVYLPRYLPPSGYTLDSYLRKLCEEALEKKFPQAPPEVRERMEKELAVIFRMNYSGYFLIVSDFVRYAKREGILVGPGRGSATGSLVAYLLDITGINPLSYGLIFERFLNLERQTMPDIDIDIQDNRRGEVINYVKRKYGEESVAQIITFGTMAARAAVRDVGRVLGMSYGKVDRIAKLIPFNTPLHVALEQSKGLKELIREDEEVRTLFEIAQRIEGLTRHASTHAAGVVIAPGKLTRFTPLFQTNKSEITTQYEMHSLEAIGLLKIDFLGLKTLNVIQDTLRIIKKTQGIEIDLKKIPLNDSKTYKLLSRGETLGIFQLESRGMQDLIEKLSPQRFEDLIALLALYRPGPLQSGMVEEFIARKQGKSKIDYLHPKLKPILEETYGVILYQEQVMQIANVLAGFSLGEADVLRWAMGKKKPELMEKQKEKFIKGAVEKEVDRETAERIFNLIAHFAGYGFNKSHSTGYALISYQTAYLKARFPVEFMASLLTSEKENTDKLASYIGECRRMGIRILPPDINESFANFTVVKNAIRFGLAAIKNVGETAIGAILEERKRGGKFTSIFDFCRRVDLRAVNKKVLESLIKCGAFDGLPGNRAQNLAVIEKATEEGSELQRDRERGQISFFEILEEKESLSSEEQFPEVEEIPYPHRLSMEKELLGFYVSGHPFEKYESILSPFCTGSLKEIKEKAPELDKIRAGGVVISLSSTRDRKGRNMAFFTLEDMEEQLEVVVFSDVFEDTASYLKKGEVLLVEGRLDTVGEKLKLVAQSILPPSSLQEKVRTLWLLLEEEDLEEEKLKKIKSILLSHRGDLPLYLQLKNKRGEKVLLKSNLCKVGLSGELMNSFKNLLGKEKIFWREK